MEHLSYCLLFCFSFLGSKQGGDLFLYKDDYYQLSMAFQQWGDERNE
jgi:hypothetical protein